MVSRVLLSVLRQATDGSGFPKVEWRRAQVERQSVYLCHVPKAIGNPCIGGADDQANCAVLTASDALGEREDQFLQGGRSER